jgi:antitoxin ParD1/3/4
LLSSGSLAAVKQEGNALNVSLTPELERFIRERVDSGRYHSSSEVVREALRLLEEREQLRALRLEELRREIQRGVDSGPAVDGEEVFARLRARYESMTTRRDG